MVLVGLIAVPVLANAPNTPSLPTPQEYLKLVAGNDYPLLNSIVICESGWHANAKNKSSTASGLFQFLSSTWNKWGQGDVFDPYNNINAAVDLYHAEGTRPWNASKSCWQ